MSVLGLVLTGCAGEGAAEKGSASPTRASTGKLLPKTYPEPKGQLDLELPDPADDAPLSEQLEHELRERTLTMAQAEAETSAECPEGLKAKKGEKVRCTVDFDGHRVAWRVTFGKASGIGSLVEYKATPEQGVFTREGALRLIYGNSSARTVRCTKLPATVLVKLDEPTKFECQPVLKGQSLLPKKIRVTNFGPRAY